jgi:hypothetical protein
MTGKDTLHRLVDELPEGHLEEARRFLEDLRESEVDDEPLTAEDLESVRRGLEDLREGRTKTLEQYERERGL